MPNFYEITGLDRDDFRAAMQGELADHPTLNRDDYIPDSQLNRLPLKTMQAIGAILGMSGYGVRRRSSAYSGHYDRAFWNVKMHGRLSYDEFLSGYKEGYDNDGSDRTPAPSAVWNALHDNSGPFSNEYFPANFILEQMWEYVTEDDTYRTASPEVLKRWGLSEDCTWDYTIEGHGRSGGYMVMVRFNDQEIFVGDDAVEMIAAELCEHFDTNTRKLDRSAGDHFRRFCACYDSITEGVEHRHETYSYLLGWNIAANRLTRDEWAEHEAERMAEKAA